MKRLRDIADQPIRALNVASACFVGLIGRVVESEDGVVAGAGRVELFDPGRLPTIRYRYGGAVIPTPWSGSTTEAA